MTVGNYTVWLNTDPTQVFVNADCKRLHLCATTNHCIIAVGCVSAEMPQEAWKNHLEWLTASLQRLTEQEEEEEDSQSSRLRERKACGENVCLLHPAY